MKIAQNKEDVKKKKIEFNNRPEVLEEHRKRQFGKPKSEETKIKMRKPKSEQHRKNMKLAQNRPEVLEKQRKPRGPFSKEHINNMILAHSKRNKERKYDDNCNSELFIL